MKRILVILAVALLSFGVTAQQVDSRKEPQGLVSFRILPPEGPVTQGDRVQLRYELVTTHYKISGFDGGMEGAVLESVGLEKPDSGNPRLYRVLVNAVCRVTACGPLKVKPMSCFIGEERVRSDSLVLEVLPHPEYGQEWQQARQFLQARGSAGDGLRLEYRFGREGLCAFSDPVGKAFAFVVRHDFQAYIENPILAWGIGNAMWEADEDEQGDAIDRILQRYDRQLVWLRRQGGKYRGFQPSSHEPDPAGVAPLLGTIAFGQAAPYNRLFPKEKLAGRDSSCVAGCGPVALAQILRYYRHPVQPHGLCNVTTKSGRRYRLNLSDYPVRWDDPDPAPLMLACAGSVLAEMGTSATSSSLYNFKSALINHWDYSPQCTWIDNYHDANMLAMLYRELDEGRPVIVADDSHLMVADGYYQDYFHLNLGWGGYCNGYYRAILVPSLQERQLPFREMLIGIRPMAHDEALTRKVNVREPGTLARLLGEDRQRITRLVVSGKLDGDDLECIRSMAGAPWRLGDYEHGHGSLMELDLSRATIVSGKPYAYTTAEGVTLNGSAMRLGRRFDYKYKVDELTEADWKEIHAWGIDDNASFRLDRTPEGQVYLAFKTKDNVVGAHLFAFCDNLRSVWLPQNAKAVEHEAFIACRALEHVYNLPADTAPGAFKYAVRYQPE
jgi:Peptidase C10 family.